jgi:hypothetical protein
MSPGFAITEQKDLIEPQQGQSAMTREASEARGVWGHR